MTILAKILISILSIAVLTLGYISYDLSEANRKLQTMADIATKQEADRQKGIEANKKWSEKRIKIVPPTKTDPTEIILGK